MQYSEKVDDMLVLFCNGLEFSFTDMEDNPEIIKSFGYADKDQIHGMIVFGKNGMNALVKLPGEIELKLVTKLVVVGYPMIISIPENTIIKGSKKRYNRQSFLGKDAQLIFSQIKVGIFGLGGGGSHIIQQLAHLGIKNYVLYDFDTVDETNLNRMIGACLNDVKNVSKKTIVAENLIRQLHEDANINIVNDNWTNAPEFLQECDIVFGCVDSYLGRRDIESECRRYLIPYIDIGMDVYDEFRNEAPNLVGQIILSMPGDHCMHCMGFLTEQNLAKEAAKYGAVGGRPQVVWSNGVLASQAVGVFVDLVTGWSGIKEITSYYSFDGNKGILTPHPRLKYLNKICSHFEINGIGTLSRGVNYVGITVSFVLPPLGAEIITVGGALGTASAIGNVGLDLYERDYKGVAVNIGAQLLNRYTGTVINKDVDGLIKSVSKGASSEGMDQIKDNFYE